ncbi:unnamed protein product, partial [Gadus morhua 'NCC']
MQNPEGSAAAAQRQQQAQAAEQQRETAESLALLREAVLRPEHAVRDAPITAPTSPGLRADRPEGELARGAVGPYRVAVPHRTSPSGEPRPAGGDRPV